MTAPRHSGADPAPHSGRVYKGGALFAVTAPPLAWLVQLCSGFAMASTPCYRAGVPLLGGRVPFTGLLVVTLLCLAVTLVALLVAMRDWRATRDEHGGGSENLIEVGHGRTRFLALWGMNLGAGFALILVANLVALLGMPSCAP